MRARTILALATLAAAPLAAQRSHQFEFGAFGSFTRYDRAFNLGNQIGGGGRLGYFFGEHVGVELDAGYQSPRSEERRVGKECRRRRARGREKKDTKKAKRRE